MQLIDLTGQRFGMWTVLYRNGHSRCATMWRCRCDCGIERDVASTALRQQEQRSCRQCWYKKRRIPVNMTEEGLLKKQHPREWNSWKAMMGRCLEPKWKGYRLYGGRGIRVAKELRTFAGFYAALGDRPPNTSLDRIDSNGDYEPTNLRWANPVVQGNNSRWNRRMTLNGETMTIAEWARKYGIRHSRVRSRLARGLSLSEALSRPCCYNRHP